MTSAPSSLRWIYALGLLAALFYAGERIVFPKSPGGGAAGSGAREASRLMARALDILPGCAEARGVVIDRATDLNRTGLIGLENSPITTSLGQLEAKRTAANPGFAGCVAGMLTEAGVRRGDAVAVGASSSFPALVVATLSAVHAIGAAPVVISSLGASNWGANNPQFTQLEILDCLRSAGLVDVRPAALAVGGDRDDGSDMSAEGREMIREKLRATGLPVIEERDLASNVRARMAIYAAAADGRRIAAFVNVGGSWANMGIDSSILRLRPGLTEVVEIPPEGRRGVIQEMASRGVPVIHLLFVKGLAERCGLPWDPVPLPRPDDGGAAAATGRTDAGRLLLLAAYIVLAAMILTYIGLKNRLTSKY